MSQTESYIEKQKGCYRVAGTRVSLDSIVYAFLDGDSPETIAQSFPALTLEQVYGAIAFYLAHEDEVDRYLSEGEREFEELRRATREAHLEWREKMERARREATTPRR